MRVMCDMYAVCEAAALVWAVGPECCGDVGCTTTHGWRFAHCAVAHLLAGILVGIGETREERLEALLQILAIQLQYDHIQELIIQNFR
jgi:hypothetical protein